MNRSRAAWNRGAGRHVLHKLAAVEYEVVRDEGRFEDLEAECGVRFIDVDAALGGALAIGCRR